MFVGLQQLDKVLQIVGDQEGEFTGDCFRIPSGLVVAYTMALGPNSGLVLHFLKFLFIVVSIFFSIIPI